MDREAEQELQAAQDEIEEILFEDGVELRNAIATLLAECSVAEDDDRL
jgi:hypothetical protein